MGSFDVIDVVLPRSFCIMGSTLLPCRIRFVRLLWFGVLSAHDESFRRQGTYNAFAADVWAAGVCLWVFRFGTPPFYDPDPSTLFLDICGQPLHFPVNADEGDEEVIAAEKEAEELAKARVGGARMCAGLCLVFFLSFVFLFRCL